MLARATQLGSTGHQLLVTYLFELPAPHYVPLQHPAALRAIEIDRKAVQVDVFGPFSDAVAESERVEKLYGMITDDYRYQGV